MSANQTMPTFPPGYLDENDSYQLVIVGVLFIVVNTAATVARAVSRRMQGQDHMASDWLMPVSLVFNIGVCICILLGAKWGAGRHIQAIPMDDIIRFTYLTYYGMGVVYVGAVTFSKLAIVDLYLHIFTNQYARATIYTVAAILVATCVANFITIMAQCHPFASAVLYDPMADGWCHNIHAHFTWASLPNIVTDFILLVLPIPLVVRLQQPWRVKLGIFLTFLVGSVGIITAIVRLDQFYTYGWDTTNADPSWEANIIFTWTCVEPGVYHLAACLITLRPLMSWLAHDSPFSTLLSRVSLLSRRSDGSTYNSDNHKRSATSTFRNTYKQKSIANSDHDDELLDSSEEGYRLGSQGSVHSQDKLPNPAFANGIRVDREFTVA